MYMIITNALTIYLDRCILMLPYHSHYSQSSNEPKKKQMSVKLIMFKYVFSRLRI